MWIRITIAAALLGVAGCTHKSIERQAEDVREEALDLAAQTAEISPDVPHEQQLEQRIEVAEAREALVRELRAMSQVLANHQSRAATPEAQRGLFTLQQRYEALAGRLETAGTDPQALAEIQEDVAELDRDVMIFGGGFGT